MTTFLKRMLLPATVFVTGASVLIIEVVAIRVLAPYYGNTIFTVSSVVSVILAALSIGYYAGGTLADRHPSYVWFFGIILVSGLGVLFFHLIGGIVLPLLSFQLSLAVGPLVSSVLLFLLPPLLLGMLSPYAIKLQSVYGMGSGIGNISGTIFFWSTLGSIVGSLLAGFALIPNFGIDQIIVGNGIALFVLGLVPLAVLGAVSKHLHLLLFAFALVATALSLVIFPPSQEDVVYSTEGIYQKIILYDGEYAGRPARFLRQDRNHSGAMFLDSEDPRDLAYGYSKYHALYKILTPNPRAVLIIGSGASSMLKAMLAELPAATFDIVDIEPSLFDLAETYFRVPRTPRLVNHVEDGRRFLRDTSTTYDVIFSDVASSLFSMPSHFATREFFAVAKEKLNEGGVFIVNMIGDLAPEPPSIVMSEVRTFQTVFPNSYFFAVASPETADSQNIILVGSKSDRKLDFKVLASARDLDPVLRSLGSQVIDVSRLDLTRYRILTDNYAPTEYLGGKALQNYSGFEKAFRLSSEENK